MSSEFDGLGLSAETLEKIERLGNECRLREAAEDENRAAVKANELGLSGQAADDFKARYVAGLNEGRAAARQHCKAVLESPEGKARPSAAKRLIGNPRLTTEEAIAELAAMPPEVDETEAAADFILGAGR